MRIGIYDPYLDDLGGGEKYMMTIAETLSVNHQVDVFWDKGIDIDILLERFSIDLSRVSIVENIFKKEYSKIKRMSKTRAYDILIILSDGSIPVTLSKKTYLHIQQPLPLISPSLKSGLKLKKISAVFCNSEFTKKFIDKELGVTSIVIYPPVDIKPKNIKKENIILNVGRFRVKDITTKINGEKKPLGDFKKQGVLVDAFKDMFSKGLKGWKLVIATSVNKQDLENFEQLKNNAKNFPIEFLVNKSNNQLWDIYSKSKIYWHASGFGENIIEHPEFSEHFGISTVEAMGAGAVPVVINSGGQKEIVTDNLNGLLWSTIKELQEKTEELINNNKLMLELSNNAKMRSKDFGKQKFSGEINNLISK